MVNVSFNLVRTGSQPHTLAIHEAKDVLTESKYFLLDKYLL